MRSLGKMDTLLLEMRKDLEKAYLTYKDADIKKVLARLTLFEEITAVVLDLLMKKGIITQKDLQNHLVECEEEFRAKIKKHQKK